MTIILFLLGLIIIGIGGFYVAYHLIKIWTGCNSNEAVTRLHNILNGKVQYNFSNDIGFENDVSINVRNVIGDKRYQQLMNIANTAISTPLLSFGENSGLPYIAISMYYSDENEKQILENVLTNLVRNYLKIYGFDLQMLVDWKMRYDLNMPILETRYARNNEEKRILEIGLQNNRQIEIMRNTVVTDDTEADELDG